MNDMELVSPAGSFDQLRAAANAGADAVYLAYEKYGARAYAENFNLIKLEEAVLYSHSKKIKAYLTLNTLIKEKELEELLEFIFSTFKKINFDGIIIQDLAIKRIINKIFPDIPIHASTQLNLHNLYSIELLKIAGFKRAILAREMTLSEISRITSKNIMDIEIFGHGSQCYSYSGQCYFSSFVGERSGNRGRCPQPCRMKYDLLKEKKYDDNNNTLVEWKDYGDKKAEVIENNCYFLSKNDLNSIYFLPQIIKSGVKALKIEGRMKTPEYVGIVTKIYRKYIDLHNKNPEKYFIEKDDIYKLKQIFSREFSEGYFKEEYPKNIVSLKKSGSIGNYFGRVCEISSGKYQDTKIKDIFIKSELKLNKNDILEFWTKKGNDRIKIKEFEMIDSKLPKKTYKIQTKNDINLNDRVFKYYDFDLDMEAKSLYMQKYDPTTNAESKFNVIIDECNYNKLKKILSKKNHKTTDLKKENKKRGLETLAEAMNISSKTLSISLFMRDKGEKSIIIIKNIFNIINSNKLKYDESFPNIKICYDDLKNMLIKKDESYKLINIMHEFKNENIDFYIITPNIIYDSHMSALKKAIKNYINLGFNNFYISNMGVLHLLNEICKADDFRANIILGYSLNISNSLAISEIKEYLNKNIKITDIVFSPELTIREINEIILSMGKNRSNKEMFHDMDFSIYSYGFFPVMTSRVKYTETEGTKKDLFNYYIKDMKKFKFKIGSDYLGNTILFNSRKHCLFFDMKEIINNYINGFLMDFRSIEGEEIYFIFKSFLKASALLKSMIDIKPSNKKDITKHETKYKELILKTNDSIYMKNYTKGHSFRSIL